MKQLIRLSLLVLLSGMFAACGGGSNGSSNAADDTGGGSGGGGGNPPAPPAPPAQSFNGFVISEVAKTSDNTDPKDTNSITFKFNNTDETAFDSVL